MSTRNFRAIEATFRESPAIAKQQVLASVLNAIASNTLSTLPQHFTEDIELHIHGFPELDGAWHGCDAVVKALANNFGKVTDQVPQIETVIEQGDNIAMLINETGILNQRKYNVRVTVWFTFEGSRIERVVEFAHLVFC